PLRIEPPVARQLECRPVILERELAALPGGNATADRSRIEVGELDENGLAIARFDQCIARDRLRLGFYAGRSHSLVEYAAVAHHDQTGLAVYLVQPDNLRS